MELTELEQVHDVPVLHVAGDIDLSTSQRLRTAINDLLARHVALIVVDLTKVTFLDSAGLKVLDEVQRRAEADGTRIALACPQNRLIRLLQITGLDVQFPIHDTPEKAARSGGTDD